MHSCRCTVCNFRTGCDTDTTAVLVYGSMGYTRTCTGYKTPGAYSTPPLKVFRCLIFYPCVTHSMWTTSVLSHSVNCSGISYSTLDREDSKMTLQPSIGVSLSLSLSLSLSVCLYLLLAIEVFLNTLLTHFQ
jgi:hypothetical protein